LPKAGTVKKKQVSVGRGKYRIDLIAIVTNDGLIVSITGGEKSHVGAVAVGLPRPSLERPSKLSATTSVLTLFGHKDDELAKPAAEKLAKELNQTVVVVAGVHVEEARLDDIRKLVHNSMQVVDVFLEKLRNSSEG